MGLLVFCISALLAFALGPVVIKWYTRNNWLDNPNENKQRKYTHTKPVPRGGGLIIFATVLLASFLFLHFDKYLVCILLGAGLLAGIGLLDDIYDLHPGWRLLGGLVASLLVVGSGIGIAYLSNPFGPEVIHLNQPQLALYAFGKTRTIWIIADLFAVLFIIWNMNIVNWSKGVDGQLPGFASAALVVVGLLSYRFIDDPTQFNTAFLSFIVAGAFAGYLYWNWYPQKSMPGYGAGSLAGYFLAVLSILSGAKLATTLMVLAIPTADAVFTIGRRLYARKSPIWGDRGHLHHKLLDVLGWGRRRIALFYAVTSLSLGLLSLYLNTAGKLITFGVVVLFVFGFLIWAKLETSKEQTKK